MKKGKVVKPKISSSSEEEQFKDSSTDVWDENFVFGNTPNEVKIENSMKLLLIDEEENKFLAVVGLVNILIIGLTFIL